MVSGVDAAAEAEAEAAAGSGASVHASASSELSSIGENVRTGG